jgi:hypothetical protein
MRASPFQAVKTWKTSTDPDYEAKKNQVLELYAIADGITQRGRPDDFVGQRSAVKPLNGQPPAQVAHRPKLFGGGRRGIPMPGQPRPESFCERRQRFRDPDAPAFLIPTWTSQMS